MKLLDIFKQKKKNYSINIEFCWIKLPNSEFRIKVNKKNIEGLSDFELLQMNHERICDFCCDKHTGISNFNKLNKSQRTLYSIFIIVGDVNNGGFIQFFQNTKDEFFDGGLMAFTLIKDIKTHKIFSEAIMIYKRNKKFLSAEDLDAPLNKSDERRLDKLEEKFYDLDDEREKKLIRYVKENLSDFIIIKE